MAVAVAFSSGNEHFLLASMDNGGVAEVFQKAVREAVVKLEPAIDPEKIFINAIHTHNAPAAKVPMKVKGAHGGVVKAVADPNVYTPQEYIDFVVPVMAQNLVNAWKNRKEGGIARAFGFARVGHCRRAVFADGTAEMYGML